MKLDTIIEFFKDPFGHHGKSKGRARTATYASSLDFVAQNIADIKQLLSFTGYNDATHFMDNVAQMTGCQILALCQLCEGQGKFRIVKLSNRDGRDNREIARQDEGFAWQHIQPWASMDYATVIDTLPFKAPDCTVVMSVPVKDEHNMLAGVMIGLSKDKSEINAKLQLLHLLTPRFEAELRSVKQKQDIRELQHRIASLNQNIEVLNADLSKERNIATESRRLRSSFLTNLSHEIRTPMNAIVGFLDLLQSSKDEKEREDFMGIVKQNCQQLLRVIDNLIDMSKLQSNYMLKPASPVQLNELLTEIKMKYENVLRRSGKEVTIETVFSLETPNDTIWSSDEIIRKVMNTLMDNACRYTQSGRITISYTINNTEATFCVADTGPGIKPGLENKLFDLFDEAADIDSNIQIIKGAGLAIASKYLSLAGGRIWLDASYTNGACFYFSIPKDKL